jgi:O-antigen/teichoic acid export membrane protein
MSENRIAVSTEQRRRRRSAVTATRAAITTAAGRVRKYFSEGNKRSIRAKRNIAALLFRKGLGVVISFLLVPLTLSYLGTEKYGIWLTMTSVVAWMYFFDFGLGNGMRNKVAEALALGERHSVRMYVSTAYAVLGGIALILLVLFLAVYPILPWERVFQAPAGLESEVARLVLIVFAFFCMQFVFALVNTLLTADQHPAAAGYLSTIGSAISLGVVILLMKFGEGSLVHLGIGFGLANLLPLIGASVYLYRSRYKEFAPRWSAVDLSKSKDLLSLGVKFFLLQSAAIIIYATDNMIITQILGPSEVAVYGIAFKYMSAVTMVFGIVITPFWSAFTDAYHRSDLRWIERIMRRLITFWGYAAVVTILLVAISGFAYQFWVGDMIAVPFAVTITMAVYVIVNAWNSVFASFQNGVGVLRLQLIGAGIGGVINIPLAVFLAGPLGLGIPGVLLATIIGSLLPAVMSPIQFRKIMSGTAVGIWGK